MRLILCSLMSSLLLFLSTLYALPLHVGDNQAATGSTLCTLPRYLFCLLPYLVQYLMMIPAVHPSSSYFFNLFSPRLPDLTMHFVESHLTK